MAGRDLKFWGEVAAYSVIVYPRTCTLLPFRAAATAALALRRVTGNYDNFEKLFSHVYATACTRSGVAATHPSVAYSPPPSSPPCLAVFDANRLQLHEHGNGILLLRNFKLQRDLRVFFASLNSSTGLYRSIWVFARSETRLGTIILEWESLLIELSPVFQIHVYLSSYYFARFAFFFFIRKIWVI